MNRYFCLNLCYYLLTLFFILITKVLIYFKKNLLVKSCGDLFKYVRPFVTTKH